jgi:glycerol-3-phosphate acyltransferase PlsY
MGYLAVILGAYILGSSSKAFYIGKLTKKDLGKNGSGNLGASNTLVLLGWQAGVLVGVHDIGKGLLSVLLARWLFPELQYAPAAAGVACVLGHIFPFYLKFKGGKGLASYIGMMVALNWKLALVVLVVLVVATLITNYIVAGTVSTIVVFPAATLILTGNLIMVLILCIPTVVMLFKHRENFSRIRNGTEVGLRSAVKGEHKMK